MHDLACSTPAFFSFILYLIDLKKIDLNGSESNIANHSSQFLTRD